MDDGACSGGAATGKFVASIGKQQEREFGVEVGPQENALAADLGPGAQMSGELDGVEADFMGAWGGSHMSNIEAMERSMGMMGMEAMGGMGQLAGLEHAADFEEAFAEQMKVPLLTHTHNVM